MGCSKGCPLPEDRLSRPLCYQADISQSPAECYQSSAGNGRPFISILTPSADTHISPTLHTHTLINLHTSRAQSSLNLAFVYLLKLFETSHEFIFASPTNAYHSDIISFAWWNVRCIMSTSVHTDKRVSLLLSYDHELTDENQQIWMLQLPDKTWWFSWRNVSVFSRSHQPFELSFPCHQRIHVWSKLWWTISSCGRKQNTFLMCGTIKSSPTSN